MIKKIKLTLNFIQNMGLRYVLFRIYYAISIKLGRHKRKFPVNPEVKFFITLNQWKTDLPPFFFYGKEIQNLPKIKDESLKHNVKDIESGIFTFFSKQKFHLGKDYDWITNPTTKHQYNIEKHWSEIQDLTASAGDIKFVWEKARFSFLYDIIRYDYHFEEDKSHLVFSEIEDFIDKNPINQGPNYKCSQEISLRILNWTFALYYYKDSVNLTEHLFQKIINAIYWQLHHIRYNIHFSRIAVRNNHAITETLMLYLSNKLFPFIPETTSWSKKGKNWFEQEVDYQIYSDGTFLQFSMNYHRVVIQLLTWGIQLAKLNNEHFSEHVYVKAQKSLEFLDNCRDRITGKLPNYGSNDGALFFKLTNDDFRNYTSQLENLRAVLKEYTYSENTSSAWYGVSSAIKKPEPLPKLSSFNVSGYFIIQEKDTKTFIRCGSYKDRPFQSDNLHLDLWVNGVNYLRDSGSYKYNTSNENLSYFTGCQGHNTVSISKADQMLRGGRFIWYYWTKKSMAALKEEKDTFTFNGQIKGFQHLGKSIFHSRNVTKVKGKNQWYIKDIITNKGDRVIYQYWHFSPDHERAIEITTTDRNDKLIVPLREEKWYSSHYGIKEKSIRLTFASKYHIFNTKISIRE